VAKKAKAEAKRIRRDQRKNTIATDTPPERLDFDRQPPDDVD
jgi:hypothetical protein